MVLFGRVGTTGLGAGARRVVGNRRGAGPGAVSLECRRGGGARLVDERGGVHRGRLRAEHRR
jgi:hypothetical protein